MRDIFEKPKKHPLYAVRALALKTQALDCESTTDADSDQVLDIIKRIGYLQIDTLQRVRRSQYLVLWSRLGNYETEQIDELLSGGVKHNSGDRQLFEYWLHAACLIPFQHYRYCLPKMRKYRKTYVSWRQNWIEQSDHRRLVNHVLSHIQKHGPTRSMDFPAGDRKRGAWWDWKPAKIALEYLYNQGDLMVCDRRNFQRVYDLKRNVLPNWVNEEEPTELESIRYFLENSLRYLGVCEIRAIPDYAHIKRNIAKPILEELVNDGTFVQIESELKDRKTTRLVVHREHLSDLEWAADGKIVPNRTTFLSPFDNLFWAKRRVEQFWGFNQVLEAYKPEKIRRWGYFCMPILYKDRLVGRFDPKLDRKSGTLILKELYLESDDIPLDSLVVSMGHAMSDFMAFHDVTNLVIEKSNPPEFGRMLLNVL